MPTTALLSLHRCKSPPSPFLFFPSPSPYLSSSAASSRACFPFRFLSSSSAVFLHKLSSHAITHQNQTITGNQSHPSFSSIGKVYHKSLTSQNKSEHIVAYSGLKEASTERMATLQSTVWMRIVQDGIFRFDATEKTRDETPPSLSFSDPKARETPLPLSDKLISTPEYLPYSSSANGQQTMVIELPLGTSFYGTGEVSGSLERTGKRVFAWNSDAWGYGPSTTSLYQSHPWVLAVLPDGRAFGVLADTTQKCEIDLRKESTIRFVAPASYPVITFGPFAAPATVMTSLSLAIGTIPMPPKWSLGYHQCRWSYEPDSRVLEIAKSFRERKIPCDVIWMDIDYMDGFRCFTFHPEKFSDPQKLASALHEDGFKAVWMLDPGIRSEAGYAVYDSGSSESVWVLSSKKKTYIGEVWPGPCVFPDYTSEKTRKWWADLVSKFIDNGVDGIWNDMNEPTVFKTVTKTMPDNNFHCGDSDVGGSQNHSYYHNVYGMLMARSTYEGMLLGNPSKRPFVLTRAGFIGSQRYAATWTGDNLSTWDHLHMSVSMALNMGLSGQPFCGPDIGGFAGDATPKLYARWMGIGALLPFSRGHSEEGTIDHEPWSFGDECEKVCRLALERRYRLLPHLYSLFYKSHTTGVPVMTPLFFSDSTDPKLRKVEDSFLLGPVLVCVSTDKRRGSSGKEAVLPSGIWQEFNFDDDHDDLPLLYLHGGSIIPTGTIVQHTGDLNASNELTIIIALDKNGKAEGLLYEDDGSGFGYQKEEYLLTTYSACLDKRELLVKIGSCKGQLKRPKRTLNVHLLVGATAKLVCSGIDGEDIKLRLPADSEIGNLIAECEKKRNFAEGSIQDEVEVQDPLKGLGAPRSVMELSNGAWKLKVVPWIGGRIISMVHAPTGIEWLWSRVEKGGYEEYSATEYRSSGCTEEYDVVKQDIPQIGESEAVLMDGNIDGGLSLQRSLVISKAQPQLLQIKSSIIAKSSLAGSGGFSRVACLRVHPTFQLRHPTETFIRFTSVDGNVHSLSTDSPEMCLQDDERPNGEWRLVDECDNVSLVNRFKLEEVEQCLICWGPSSCNLELWSTERPVSKDTPISIHHVYETVYQG